MSQGRDYPHVSATRQTQGGDGTYARPRRRRSWDGVRSWFLTYTPAWLPACWFHPVVGYLVAFLLPIVAVTGTALLLQAFPMFHFQGVLVMLAILLVAFNWGEGPGILTALVGAALQLFLLLPPVLSLAVARPEDALGLCLYLGVGFTISVLTGQTQRARRHAAACADQLQAVFEAMVDEVIVYDGEGRILQMNTAARDRFECDLGPDFACLSQEARSAAILLCDAQGQPLPPERRPLARLLKGEVLTGANTMDILIRTLDGREVCFNVSGAPVHDPQGNLMGAVSILRDVTGRRQLECRLRDAEREAVVLATTDPVTTLPNHRALLAQLEHELGRAQQYNRACSLLFLDLDHFKALNDGYGHVVGDAVLAEFAHLVQSRLRGMDTLGRWGGEEFVAILPELQAGEALALAEKVRTAVAAHVFCVGGGLRLTCSVGVASYPTHAQEREGLIRAADHAMYGAKRFGRNQVRAADDPAVLALHTVNYAAGGREEAALVGMVEALATLVTVRDFATGHHSQLVADLVLRMALAMGLPVSEAQMIALAGRLHDVGKVAIPDALLQKRSLLAAEEWELMQVHPVVGADVVSHIPALRPLAPMIRAHHERWDGQGYPDRLKGEAIPMGARILMVADAYLAMTMNRPYQQARVPAAALAELRRCAGSQFDPQVVEALEQALLAE